jgi:hypothetical protein
MLKALGGELLLRLAARERLERRRQLVIHRQGPYPALTLRRLDHDLIVDQQSCLLNRERLRLQVDEADGWAAPATARPILGDFRCQTSAGA